MISEALEITFIYECIYELYEYISLFNLFKLNNYIYINIYIYIVNINNNVVDFTSEEKIALVAEVPKKKKNLKMKHSCRLLYYIV